MSRADHGGWRGRGRIHAARVGGQLVLRIDSVRSRAGPLQAAIREFCRKYYRELGPRYGPFAVAIWIATPAAASGERGTRIDADNVAKACLDALTGIVWRDDSQVQRLSVEKIVAETPAITLVATILEEPPDGGDLAALLSRIDALD